MIRLFLLTFLLQSAFLIFGQSAYQVEVLTWQSELNAEFANPEDSPLEKKAFKKFEGLDYFPISEKYRVVARFEHTPFAKPFTMPTTTKRQPVYVQYGIAHFTLDSQSVNFPVYQNIELREIEGYEDYLFAPFTDLTNGAESYGGGRYLDLKLPEGDSIILDFNKAYNPYCAYNGKYSCPIPPAENDLALRIEAGVKAWENDKK